MFTYSFCRFTQAALELAGREKWGGVGRLSMSLWSRMSHSLILTDALSSICWEKKRKKRGKKKEKETSRDFFPRAGHALLALLHGVFMAVR
jgi:hypothetical protein